MRVLAGLRPPQHLRAVRRGHDRTGVVAHAFKERRYWNEVDQAGEDYRQQPGDRQLPAWIPTSHHFPLYTSVERVQQACRAIGGKNSTLTALLGNYGATVKARNKQIVAVIGAI